MEVELLHEDHCKFVWDYNNTISLHECVDYLGAHHCLPRQVDAYYVGPDIKTLSSLSSVFLQIVKSLSFCYFRHQQYMDEYPKLFLVGVDNVGSKQMQQIRQSLRGRAEVLMGKNTMIRKAIRGHLDNNPNLEK